MNGWGRCQWLGEGVKGCTQCYTEKYESGK